MAAKTSGGQAGNQNPAKNRPWADAINRALLRTDAKSKAKHLDRLARALIEKAADGDVPALKEIGDRVDGKVPQGVELGGQDGKPIEANLTLNVVFRSPGDNA